jgi:hypothetical protein
MMKEMGHLFCGTRRVADQIIWKILTRQQLHRSQLNNTAAVKEFVVSTGLKRGETFRQVS